jgi:hypothetical protein
VASLALSACGQTDATVRAECASPDGQLNAISWTHSGGGAAGWVAQVVTVVPVDRSSESILKKVTAADGVVAQFAHAGHLTLTWLSARSLRVDYPNSSEILSTESDSMIVAPKPTPLVKMTYRGVVDESGDTMRGLDTCGRLHEDSGVGATPQPRLP